MRPKQAIFRKADVLLHGDDRRTDAAGDAGRIATKDGRRLAVAVLVADAPEPERGARAGYRADLPCDLAGGGGEHEAPGECALFD